MRWTVFNKAEGFVETRLKILVLVRIFNLREALRMSLLVFIPKGPMMASLRQQQIITRGHNPSSGILLTDGSDLNLCLFGQYLQNSSSHPPLSQQLIVSFF